jgi:hypothetical protein
MGYGPTVVAQSLLRDCYGPTRPRNTVMEAFGIW